MTLRTTFCAAAFTLACWAAAQSECGDYWKNAPRSSDARFSVNGQSKGASVQVGVPTELNIIIYKGQDYRISFVYDEKVIGDHIVARLIEKVREPKQKAAGDSAKAVLSDTRKVIWDNQDHEMADAVEFTATATKRIAIEVTAPGVPDGKDGPQANDIGCVGILIEHMPTPAVGF